jgi:integrase
VTWAVREKGYSQRRACRLVGLHSKTYRYVTKRSGDEELRRRLRELASQRRRFGYRRLGLMLERQGIRLNGKKLYRLDIAQGRLDQDARQVNTKFSKTFTTWFFPVGGDILEIVADWVAYLRQKKLWGLDDPLFPATKIALGASRHFEASGLDRKHWASAGPIRKIFKDAFTGAGLSYFNPHSFRKTLALLGGQVCRSPEEYKAWSQNLGHENVMTTFSSYGEIGRHRQAEIIRAFSEQSRHWGGVRKLFGGYSDVVGGVLPVKPPSH